MPLATALIQEAARSLDAAEKSGQQIGLISLTYPQINLADAYAIQKCWVDMKRAAGRRIIGYKIGLTSKAMQASLGIAEPDSGVLFDDMKFENGSTIPAGRFIAPRIEAELAFVPKERIAGPSCRLEDVMAAVDKVYPALEILDTRIMRVDPATGKARTIVDTVADNAANAGIVISATPIDPATADLRWIGAIVSKNGEVEETGLAAGVLDHPARGIAWLANRLAETGAGAIEPGMVLLSGSFIRPLETRSGDHIIADFGEGRIVNCRFG